jgi:hypothetical protein
MDDIRNWLNSKQDYDTGARLYLQHGTNENLKKIFLEPASPFKKEKLLEALKGLLQKNTTAHNSQLKAKATAVANATISDRRWPPPADQDEITRALYLQWKPLFAEMMNLTSRIYDIALAGQADPAKKNEACIMAHRILDLDDACDDIYRKRDHYLRHKVLPEERKPLELAVDPMKIPLAYNNALRYVRDYKNKIKKDPSNEKFASQLKKYEWAVAEYKKILKIEA